MYFTNYNDAFDNELAIDKLRNETVLPCSFDFLCIRLIEFHKVL